jgi:hypothetical protein
MVPMKERHGDRQPGDDEVVIDLAHRAGERPAVGEVHEAAVEVSKSVMPPENRSGRESTAYHGSPWVAAVGGGGQEQNLGGGVEADPEDDADEEHVPGLGDRPHEPAEEPVHQAAGLELALELLLVEEPLAHPAEHLQDAGETPRG